MSFTEWYASTYKESWNEEYCLLYRFATQLSEEYEHYCQAKKMEPIWNG